MKTKILFLLIAAVWPCSNALLTAQEGANEDFAFGQKRNLFFQANADKFVTIQFSKGLNSEAAIQFLPTTQTMFEYESVNYSGFKFTIPEWLDGDFVWFFLLSKSEANKDFTAEYTKWGIVAEKGDSKGFKYFLRRRVSGYPWLRTKFPYTNTILVQNLPMNRLIPGETYLIWFGFGEKDHPDFAFSMTIHSERGQKEFGKLPLR